MSADERILYRLHCCADGAPSWADASRYSDSTIADVGTGRHRIDAE